MKKPENLEFIALGCDGVFDVLTNEELLLGIRSYWAEEQKLTEVTKNIVDLCLRRASFDNISFILIK